MAASWIRRADPHSLAAAYALDALDGLDRARFERHLSHCAACAEQARGLTEATARLAASTATRPPDGLRDRVLAAARATSQLRPEPGAAHPGRGAWPGRRWGMAIASGALAIALAIGWVAVSSRQQANQDQTRAGAIAGVMNAPDATMLTASATSTGTATVIMSHRERALVFTAARLPVLPASQRYELWLVNSSGPRPAGMLPVPHQGMTGPVVVTGLRSGDKVGVTAEPAAGTRHPTTPVILVVNLSA